MHRATGQVVDCRRSAFGRELCRQSRFVRAMHSGVLPVDGISEWIAGHQALLWWLGAGSVAMFVGSLVGLPIMVARLPTDYFLDTPPNQDDWRDRHPALRMTMLILKNLLGAVFLVGGVLMLVLPGQGILAILIGIVLLNFPGKRRLERWIIGQAAVLSAINWLRRKAGRSALKLPIDRENLKVTSPPR